MSTRIFRVVEKGQPFAVQSQKAEGGQVMKCNIVLQELGGRYANQFAGTMLGALAQLQLKPGDVVAAVLRFSTREYQEQYYQDVLVSDLYKFCIE